MRYLLFFFLTKILFLKWELFQSKSHTSFFFFYKIQKYMKTSENSMITLVLYL